jgi:uncharacterized repeat protein (TIGR02543 family)
MPNPVLRDDDPSIESAVPEEEPAEEIPPVPAVEILGTEVPLFARFGEAAWALVNLILCALGAIAAIILIVRALLQKKNDKKESDENERRAAGDTRRPREDEEDEQQRRYRLTWLATAIIAGILGVLVFILTENMSNPMALVDVWTIANAIIFAIEAVAMVFVFRTKADVIFEMNGAGKALKQKVRFGHRLYEPDAPKMQGHVFAGWYVDKDLSAPWDFRDKVQKNLRLYAKWNAARQVREERQPQLTVVGK